MMQMRTFSAASTAEVLGQIREELGPDAIILDTREHDNMVSITAALERDTFEKNSSASAIPHGWQQWHKEWDSIRQHILALTEPTLQLDRFSPRARMAFEYLQRNGMSNEAALVLANKIHQDPNATILETLSTLIPIKPFSHKCWDHRVHVITGPYGAGKTASTIRLALMTRNERPDTKICIINADAGRGNGRLLLRHYSELSKFAYKEAASPLELLEAVVKAKNENFECIFVDMPGLSKNENLASLLNTATLDTPDTAVHIALSPMYSVTEMRSLLRRYQIEQAGSIIWTKLDEAEEYGNIINVAVQTGLPTSALSYGSGMGNSLISAKASNLWKILLKSELPTPLV